MVFSSLIFLYAFLPLSLAVYALCRNLRAKNISLLVFSLIFYAWGEPVYVLLMAMALFDWYFALRVQRAQREEKNSKLWVALACVVNLGLIGFFKYAGMVCSIFGDVPAFVQRIALPLGISFYTFQLLSYVVDVYRGDAEAQDKYWHVLLYAALFHQCIAGPIVRYKTIAKELFDGRDETTDRARGCTRFAVGLAKKTVLANACGALADSLLLTDAAIGSASQLAENLAALSNTPALALWIGIIAYAFQIYFDFSAYSDMAIGLGKLFGFDFLENFNYPFISKSITEFWRRWHMTLSGWFKNYVYIPLGGSRHGKVRMLFNMFVVWSLTGLWHGAGWNFILWGMYYFALLMIEKLFLLRFFEKYPVVGWCFTFPAVVTGWVIFASDNLSAVKTYLMQMFGHLSDAGYWTMNLDLFEQTVRQYGIYLVLAFIFSTAWPYGKYRENKNRPLTILILLVLFGLCVYKMQTAASNPFLYFRF